jgi:hypothetical protein
MGKGSRKQLEAEVGEETIKRWEREGLSDEESDVVATKIARKWPDDVWRGWIDRGMEPLDSDVPYSTVPLGDVGPKQTAG